MSVPPPINPIKKPSTGRTILIIVLFLFSLCVLITIISKIWSRSPEGKIAGTTGALTATARPTREPIIVTIAPTNDNHPTSTQNATVAVTPTLLPTKEISSLTFQEIVNKSNILTQAQWKEYTKEQTGKRIHWTGYVNEVSEHKFIGDIWYTVDVCMVSYPCIQDVTFAYPKEFSLQLNKGEKITFFGDVDLSGVNDKNAYLFRVIVLIENPQITNPPLFETTQP